MQREAHPASQTGMPTIYCGALAYAREERMQKVKLVHIGEYMVSKLKNTFKAYVRAQAKPMLKSAELTPASNEIPFKEMKGNVGKECFTVVNNCLVKGKVTSVEKLHRYFIQVNDTTEIRSEVNLLEDHGKDTIEEFLKITERRTKEKEEKKELEKLQEKMSVYTDILVEVSKNVNEISNKRQREE